MGRTTPGPLHENYPGTFARQIVYNSGMVAEGTTDGAERRTVSEGVYRALKRDVITLRHPPGAPLREQDLAARYGSSRVPVREA